MKRVLVIGHSGAGKSTLSLELGRRLDLPVIHLDSLFWQPGWVHLERGPWRTKVAELVQAEAWIMDGTYDGSLDIRLPRADTVVFLDFATGLCLWRAMKRVLGGYGRVRPDMAADCPERWDWGFMRWVWRYRRDIRPAILRLLDQYYCEGTLITLRNPREVRAFLESLQ